jgi:threonine dehydrogenase-like Zn-dependent dehydrogenase
MRGLRFTGKERVELQEAPDPHPGPGEAVVRIMASSLCRSDMSLYHGGSVLERKEAVSVIPGHEPCGVVEEVGRGVPPAMLCVGDRVAIYLAIGCGHCEYCRSGYLMHCASFSCIGFDRDGGHAEKLLMPAVNCLKIPDGMSFTAGALSTDKTGTLYHAQKRMGVSARDTIAIFGMGPMGLTGVCVAKALGARIIAVDMLPSRLEMARSIGVEILLNPKNVDVVKEIKGMTRGRGADIAIDCTGKEPAQNQMLDSLGVLGKAAFIGETRASRFNVSDQFIRKQIDVMGSWYFPIWEYPEIAAFIMEHHLPLEERLLSHTFTLAQGQEAFELFDRSETGIVIFKNEGREKS